MISSLVSEEKTTPKKNQPIKTPKINKRKNKNINIVYPSLFFAEMKFISSPKANQTIEKKKKRSDVDKDETREAN
jgi:hypothetical protein